MDNELERLKQQKREIEERIKELSNDHISHGVVRFSKEHFAGPREDEYALWIKSRSDEEPARWRGVLRNRDKEAVIQSIDVLIEDLRALKCRIVSSK